MNLIEIKAKSRTGQVVTFQVAEILSIDGQPLTFGAEDVRVHLVRIHERLAVLEQAAGITAEGQS